MGTQEPVHPGRQRATERLEEPTTEGPSECTFCGQSLSRAGERVEHVIPGEGTVDRRLDYCSPSCFIREMETTAGIAPGRGGD
jgi:hypothetical protein